MKNFFRSSVLLMMATLLWGCPYRSEVPLGEPVEYINGQVLGKWMPKAFEHEAHPDYYLVEMQDTFHYRVSHIQYNAQEEAYHAKQYLCWSTRLGNIMFLNVQQQDQREVMLYRLDVMGDELMVLYEVTDNIDERFEDSASMRQFFDRHKSLSFFYTKDELELIKVR